MLGSVRYYTEPLKVVLVISRRIWRFVFLQAELQGLRISLTGLPSCPQQVYNPARRSIDIPRCWSSRESS
jgi:hypothetical protein